MDDNTANVQSSKQQPNKLCTKKCKCYSGCIAAVASIVIISIIAWRATTQQKGKIIVVEKECANLNVKYYYEVDKDDFYV